MAAQDIVIAQEGDTLDALLWRERGLGPADIAPALALNRGVGGLGAQLPAGTQIIVPPSAPAAATLPLINLWD